MHGTDMRGDAQNPKSFRECENISLFGHFIKLYGRYSSLYIDRADYIYPDTQHQALPASVHGAAGSGVAYGSSISGPIRFNFSV